MKRRDAISSMLRSDLGRKSAVYFSALVANALLGIVVYSLLTRSMDVASFGTYSFLIAFFTLTGMFFDFGIAPAGMRLMALVEDRRSFARRAGALFLLSLGVGLLFGGFVFGASFAVDAWWNYAGAGDVLRMVAPLAAVYPLQEMVLSISQGSSRMKFMSAFLLLPRSILILLLVALSLQGGLDLHGAMLATLLAMAAAIGIAIGFLAPTFRGLGDELKTIGAEVRAFGREVYAGRLVDGMTNGLDKMLISFFHGMAPVGFYAIAMTMSTPISMFSKAVSHSAYKRFVSEARIPRRILVISLLWSTVGAAALWAACQALIPLFFTDRYSEALTVLPWIMAGFGLAGLNHPFHAFLAAHRQGRAIRIMSMTSSGVNIALNVALIPFLAMTGAALAFLATYAVNIAMNLHFYRQVLREEAETGRLSVPDEENPRHG
jgi:O-antigen/teichoic acid export membrane protein